MMMLALCISAASQDCVDYVNIVIDKHFGFFFRQKGSIANKMHQIPFRFGLRPGPHWEGAHDVPPDPLVGWGTGYPLLIPHWFRRLQRFVLEPGATSCYFNHCALAGVGIYRC